MKEYSVLIGQIQQELIELEIRILAEELMNCFAFLQQDLNVFLDQIS